MSDLLQALLALSAEGRHRFHMPGHKGRMDGLFRDVSGIDYTELCGTGNLYTEEDGPIRAAERRCAELYGAGAACFLTGGSTQGIFAMLAAFCRPGDTVAIDRQCHRSVFAAMALLDLRPIYLKRDTFPPYGLCAPLTPRPLPPETVCVLLTSPTYYGVLSETAGWDVPVLLDAAHGPHLPFLPDGHKLLNGVRMAVCSAHKTLPALGQAAFLLLERSEDAGHVRFMSSLTGTSSPSYAIMASLDTALGGLAQDGHPRWTETAAFAARLRAKYPWILQTGPLDSARLTLCTGGGYQDALWLEQTYGIVCEMADEYHAVLILTPHDSPESRAALEIALQALNSRVRTPMPDAVLWDFPAAESVLTPRQALLTLTEPLPFRRAEGRIIARPIAPYPPGIPLLAPGERIEKKHLEILQTLWYNDCMDIIAVKDS